jgi:PAS domain S-box-containing protein
MDPTGNHPLTTHENRPRTTVETLPLIVWMADVDGAATYFNGRWFDYTGLTRAQSFGRGWEDVLHPDDLQPTREGWSRALAAEEAFEFECRLLRRDGQYRWFLIKAEPLFDARGQVTQWTGTCTDIEQQRGAEATKLRVWEDRFRASVEGLIDCFALYTAIRDEAGRIADFRIDDVNQSACHDIELLREEQVGRTLLEILPGHRKSGLFQALCQVVESGEPYHGEDVRYEVDHGATKVSRAMEIRATKLGEGVVAAWRDITRRRQAEQELREREEQLRIVFDQAAVGIAQVGLDGHWLRINRRLCEILGASEQELTARTSRDLTHPEDREADQAQLGRLLAGEVPTCTIEKRFLRKDGSPVWASRTMTLVRDRDGAPCHFIAIIEDVSPRMRAEVALREADRRKDEFLAMLAHELRNPLAAVTSAIQIQRLPGVNAEQVESARQVVERQTRQLARLVDDLMDVARISQGKIQLKKERLDAVPVILRAADAARGAMEQRRHSFNAAVPEAPVLVEADPARLEQMTVNLLYNAAKYTEPGGTVSLTASASGGELIIRVRDNGVGIAAEMQDRIFEPFAQVDSSLARSQGGLGLGLALVKRLAKLHGGTIDVRSDGPGKGSEFSLRLPILPVDSGQSHAGEPACPDEPSASAGGELVLVVDDNRDSTMSTAILLKIKGFKVATAHDGQAALAAAVSARPDVILLDLGLPGMSGYEVARRLRADEAFRDTVLIATSGYGQDRDRAKSEAAGIDHHLVKPVELETLYDLLSRLREQKPRR